MWQALQDEVRRQQAAFDGELRRWLDGYAAAGGRIWCARGCRGCCSLAVNCTLTEALLVAEALGERHAAALEAHVGRIRAHLGAVPDLKAWLRLHRQQVGFCPLLEENGACGVYAARPFACRALLSTRNAGWCAADFAALHPLERQAFLSSLDCSVVAFPTHYVAAAGELGRQMEEEATGRMAARFGFAVTGNLPVLVWLERKHRLSEAVGRGEEAAAALLERTGMNHPLLVALDGP
jgi:Fe-S-cluster containining protein